LIKTYPKQTKQRKNGIGINGFWGLKFNPTPTPELSPSPEPQDSEPLPTTMVIAPIASVAIVSIGLLVYFKKRKH